MNYLIKEIFYTLQGEGAQSGRPAVFCRFTGCNLWSGIDEDRADAICPFCDTDFVGTDGPGGGVFTTAADLVAAVRLMLPEIKVGAVEEATPGEPKVSAKPLVICTGGEPLLQLDDELIAAFHADGFDIGVETNGTILAPRGIDWLCVSPKAGTELVQTSGDELKLVHPQEGLDPESLASLDFKHFFLQPRDDDRLKENIELSIAWCLAHPPWRLGLQMHKIVGID
ncbi:MAG: 7-carboxy-7-deazaguanine synthase [bacterium]|nr:7-carboxy-7-deazaguanine synthase [bacterium]